MKTQSFFIASGLRIIGLLLLASTANAAELRVLCANGMQSVMTTLAPQFEQLSGHKLLITYATGGVAVQRAAEGEDVDLVIAPQPGIDALVKGGKALREKVVPIASTGISVAVRKGAPKPDISSPESFKRALLAAKSITYLDPKEGGASGIHFAKVLERLAISDEMKAKTVFAHHTDAVGTLVAKGEAELGVVQFQLLFAVQGIEVIGPLPGDLQNLTVFAAVVMARTKVDVASTALTHYLRSPEASASIRAKGMESF